MIRWLSMSRLMEVSVASILFHFIKDIQYTLHYITPIESTQNVELLLTNINKDNMAMLHNIHDFS